MLGKHFATELAHLGRQQPPVALQNMRVVMTNPDLAQFLNLGPEWLANDTLLSLLFDSESKIATQSMAQKYGGHQFGQWNPQLGDGRGLLLGDTRALDGQLWDLHLKGAGPTPYARGGDGRAVLRSSIREYLASEALHALGIPTSRALALISSNHPVYRETPETAAMVIRACQSHIRFGHFEYFYHTDQKDKLDDLFAFCFRHHFVDCANADNPHLAMLEKITLETAKLIAKWQAFGFNHGVMNTDNMSVHGVTFDFGPYAFLDDYDPEFICNHSDHNGRYSFEQQPGIALWNLNALAHGFTPYASVDEIRQVLEKYEPTLLTHYRDLMLAKLGLEQVMPEDQRLLSDWLNLLEQDQRDYHQSFRLLAEFNVADGGKCDVLRDHFIDRDTYDSWAQRYYIRLKQQQSSDQARHLTMNKVNPKYILRNYLAQEAIEAAEQGDFSAIQRLLKVLARPFDEQENAEKYAQGVPDWGKRLEISCSS